MIEAAMHEFKENLTAFCEKEAEGALSAQSAHAVTQGIQQALAAAGGVRTDVFPKEGTLIRHLPDGRDVQVKLNLDQLARGEDPNLTLAAGDILWVPETFGTRFMQFVNSNIFFRAGVSVNYNVSGVEYLNRQRQQAAGLAGRSSSLQDSFDPLGFLNRNTILNQLNTTTTGP